MKVYQLTCLEGRDFKSASFLLTIRWLQSVRRRRTTFGEQSRLLMADLIPRLGSSRCPLRNCRDEVSVPTSSTELHQDLACKFEIALLQVNLRADADPPGAAVEHDGHEGVVICHRQARYEIPYSVLQALIAVAPVVPSLLSSFLYLLEGHRQPDIREAAFPQRALVVLKNLRSKLPGEELPTLPSQIEAVFANCCIAADGFAESQSCWYAEVRGAVDSADEFEVPDKLAFCRRRKRAFTRISRPACVSLLLPDNNTSQMKAIPWCRDEAVGGRDRRSYQMLISQRNVEKSTPARDHQPSVALASASGLSHGSPSLFMSRCPRQSDDMEQNGPPEKTDLHTYGSCSQRNRSRFFQGRCVRDRCRGRHPHS